MRKDGRGRKPGPIRYPEIQKWMENIGATMSDMARWCEVDLSTLRCALRSESTSKRMIDAILQVTGMSYEEAFWEDKK
jgi:hypothetical protein